jgi:hypothetical protein
MCGWALLSKKSARSHFIVVISLYNAHWGHSLWVYEQISLLQFLYFPSDTEGCLLSTVCEVCVQAQALQALAFELSN